MHLNEDMVDRLALELDHRLNGAASLETFVQIRTALRFVAGHDIAPDTERDLYEVLGLASPDLIGNRLDTIINHARGTACGSRQRNARSS